jgi:hypothetical protein
LPGGGDGLLGERGDERAGELPTLFVVRVIETTRPVS